MMVIDVSKMIFYVGIKQNRTFKWICLFGVLRRYQHDTGFVAEETSTYTLSRFCTVNYRPWVHPHAGLLFLENKPSQKPRGILGVNKELLFNKEVIP